MNEEEIKRKAEEFARTNKERIARELTEKSKYIPDDNPISVFMAGSPGAGKTEFSTRLVEALDEGNDHKVVRIDGDELRNYIPGYTGNNSYLFQTAISVIVERIHDLVLSNKQTFLLDGTLSKYDKAVHNISRSLNKGRHVLIFYVYQKPEVAWKFTQAREVNEGRHIPKEAFISQFLGARDTIERIHENFPEKVLIYLVKKNFETHAVENIVKVERNNVKIDQYLSERYTRDDLEKLL